MSIEKIKKARDEYHNLMKTEGKVALLEEVRSFFKKHPEVGFLKWRGHVPSFCDGDPCTFTIVGPWLRKTEDDDWCDEYEVRDDAELRKSMAIFEETIRSVGDIIETVFGDCHEIVITNDDALSLEQTEYYGD